MRLDLVRWAAAFQLLCRDLDGILAVEFRLYPNRGVNIPC